MNLKVAHLISIQFGIFIGIVCCLAFSRSEYFRPRVTAERRAPMTERAAADEPRSESAEQAADTMDPDADADLAELVSEQSRTPLPNEYSPEAVERMRAEATRLYYEQIAPRPRATTTVAAVAPAYTQVVEEPAVDQTYDPAPEPVAYVQPAPVIIYSQPTQFVVFSEPRRFANRCRPASPPGTIASNPHRRPDGRGNHHSKSSGPFERPTSPSPALRPPPASPGAGHHRNFGVGSSRPTQALAPRNTP